MWLRHDMLAAVARLAGSGIWQLIHFVLLDWLARCGRIDWSRAIVDGSDWEAKHLPLLGD